jgi:hypothetical protein
VWATKFFWTGLIYLKEEAGDGKQGVQPVRQE